jgi:DNA adenine methylase
MLRYHGGKWRLAEWIIGQFPPHRVYVEPFGGAASVLLKKERSYAEIYNDLDGEIVNLFRVARDQGEDLLQRIELTPYSREEFDVSFKPTEDPVERARRTLIRSHMGFGGNLTRPNRDQSPQRTGWRTYTQKNRRSIPAGDWRNWPNGMPALIDRLRGVIIENKPAMEVMTTHDAPDALHYVDPPYVHSTRGFSCGGSVRGYRHEMNDDQHRELAAFLHTLAGAVVVSGYACELYDEIFAGWQRVEKRAMADGARERTEVLWTRNCDHGLFELAEAAEDIAG